jgi:hypothetical protein
MDLDAIKPLAAQSGDDVEAAEHLIFFVGLGCEDRLDNLRQPVSHIVDTYPPADVR